MPQDMYPQNWMGWEVDPSTRQSTHLWTKHYPVNVTLSSAQTAEDLFTVEDSFPTVNLATNPSFETANPPTGYTAAGSTLARVTTNPRTGTYSMQVTPGNTAAGEGFYWTTDSLTSQREGSNKIYLVASAYFRRASGSGQTVQIQIRSVDGATTLASGDIITLSTTYQRSTAIFELPNTTAAYRVYFVTTAQTNQVFLADSFQVELQNGGFVTDYCDGSLGVNYEWDGVAHASRSRRRGGLVAIRGFFLRSSHDAFVSFDVTASATTGRYLTASADWWNPHPIHFTKNISFVNVTSGQTPTIRGDVWGVHTMRSNT